MVLTCCQCIGSIKEGRKEQQEDTIDTHSQTCSNACKNFLSIFLVACLFCFVLLSLFVLFICFIYFSICFIYLFCVAFSIILFIRFLYSYTVLCNQGWEEVYECMYLHTLTCMVSTFLVQRHDL